MVFSTPLFLFVYLSLTLLLYYAVPLKGRKFGPSGGKPCSFMAWGERIYVVIDGSFHPDRLHPWDAGGAM